MTKRIDFDEQTGDIVVHLDTGDHRFRPPTLGAFRELMELDASRREAATQASEGGVAQTLTGIIEDRIDWWRKAGELLSDKPLPDDLPIWLGNPELIGLASDHWILHPTRALGISSLPTPGATTSQSAGPATES